MIKDGRSLNRETPILALTADVMAEQDEEYRKYFDGFLLKPVEIEKLYEIFMNGKLQSN